MAAYAVTDHGFMHGPFEQRSEDMCYYYGDTKMCGLRRKEHELKGIKVNLPPEPAQSEAETAFAAYAEAVQLLVRKKDQAYGGAWQKQGYMGNLARIMSKTARLQNMMWTDDNPAEFPIEGRVEEETITDTLKDLMALAAFMAANIEDGNRWGK